MTDITPADILLMWSLALFYAMWITHSLHSCQNLSIIVVSLVTITLIHRLAGNPEEGVSCMFLILAVVSGLVWKEVPKLDRKRRWNDTK